MYRDNGKTLVQSGNKKKELDKAIFMQNKKEKKKKKKWGQTRDSYIDGGRGVNQPINQAVTCMQNAQS